MGLLGGRGLSESGPKCGSALVRMDPSGYHSDRAASLGVGLSTPQSMARRAAVRNRRSFPRASLATLLRRKADLSVMRARSAPTARPGSCSARRRRFVLGDGPGLPNLHRITDDSCVQLAHLCVGMGLLGGRGLSESGPKCGSALVRMDPSGYHSDRAASLGVGLSTPQSMARRAGVRNRRSFPRASLATLLRRKADLSVMRARSAPTARPGSCLARRRRFVLGDGPGLPNLHRITDDLCV
jgi:delta 1-pyrroline-5-carboxylate dehydrogenase